MTTTPETILARFVAAYHQRNTDDDVELRIVFANGYEYRGIVLRDGKVFRFDRARGATIIITDHITRIDYANANYREDQPLYEREA